MRNSRILNHLRHHRRPMTRQLSPNSFQIAGIKKVTARRKITQVPNRYPTPIRTMHSSLDLDSRPKQYLNMILNRRHSRKHRTATTGTQNINTIISTAPQRMIRLINNTGNRILLVPRSRVTQSHIPPKRTTPHITVKIHLMMRIPLPIAIGRTIQIIRPHKAHNMIGSQPNHLTRNIPLETTQEIHSSY